MAWTFIELGPKGEEKFSNQPLEEHEPKQLGEPSKQNSI